MSFISALTASNNTFFFFLILSSLSGIDHYCKISNENAYGLSKAEIRTITRKTASAILTTSHATTKVVYWGELNRVNMRKYNL